jgi:hypothetical protein
MSVKGQASASPGREDAKIVRALARPGLGRGWVRACGVVGVVLISLSAVGWWLSTRVLDANGFADVVTKSSQRADVRDYIADQATLRLASSSNFVSAARPIVTDAISQAIATPPVAEAIHDFAVRAHDQIFRITQSRRVSVSSAQAALTVRTALEAINPTLAKKLPENVLSATTTISQSSTVDAVFTASKWVQVLYIPAFILGVALLVFALARARDRVHAIRSVGVTLAVAGALLIGIGAATPAFAVAASTNDPGRGESVAAFIDVLVGRLVGAGKGMVVIGVLLALAPGHDGGDLRHRVQRVRDWVARKRASRRWRFAGGLCLALLAALALTVPTDFFGTLVDLAALLLLYVAIVVCLRASGVLVTDHNIQRLHKRAIVGVLVAMVAAVFLTGSIAVALVAGNTSTPKANPTDQGCNGYIELCPQTVNNVVWPASHNAMASSAYDFIGAEHTITVAEQLNAGARFLMLDAYYGYDDDGLVRTNLAGGIDRKQLRAERGQRAVDELDRLGALTGVADTSGTKKDVYFCHNYCELGAVPASQILADIKDFLDRNLTDVVILDFEDYVLPKDLKQTLIDADLFDRVFRPKRLGEWPSLYDMVVPKNKKVEDNPRRLIVMNEKHKSPFPWLINTYQVSEETPFSFKSSADFNCNPKRGGTGKSLLIVNHWVDSGLPDPIAADKTNSTAALTQRFEQCVTERHRIPNAIAVNFTVDGDLNKAVNRFNAAIAKQSGVTPAINATIDSIRTTQPAKSAAVRSVDRLRRLPRISDEKARALLGTLADTLPVPSDLEKMVPKEFIPSRGP